jgi:hypothetical protein
MVGALGKCVALLAFLATGHVLADPAPLVWDPADHGGEVIVESRTVTRSSAFGAPWQTARSRTSQAAGVRTAEIAIDRVGAGVMVRIGQCARQRAAPLGSNGDSIAYWSIGAVSANGAFVSSMPASCPGRCDWREDGLQREGGSIPKEWR